MKDRPTNWRDDDAERLKIVIDFIAEIEVTAANLECTNNSVCRAQRQQARGSAIRTQDFNAG
jgi:hypothetical protein